jgi:hypothetical protein
MMDQKSFSVFEVCGYCLIKDLSCTQIITQKLCHSISTPPKIHVVSQGLES